MTRRRVVITGVGAVTPLGVGATVLHERWVAGCSGIEDGLGRCGAFDPQAVLDRKEARRSDRFAQLAIAAAHEAVEQAGWDAGLPCDAERIGCVVGTGIGGIGTIEQQHDTLLERGEKAVSALGVPMMMGNAAAGAIAMRYGLTGPNWGVMSACAAGAHAIGTAVRLVQHGEVEAIVTGGAEAGVTTLARVAFARMGATSRSGRSCPFDARRDGFVLGEGAGILVLEEAEAAHARGARVLGEVLGYGATADAFHLTAPQPDGRGAVRAIARCLEDAGVAPADLHCVNAHGTSTPLNDRSETVALKHALGAHAARLPVSALKSATGHLMGAGGAVEAISLLLALRARVAPPTLNYAEPEPGLDLDYVPDAPRPLPARQLAPRVVGISNSFGFGGHNAVLCLAAE
ncbi:MAG TPA: beta-ketoacyl-[acyl-carrier-protein] synthase family protein [Conexibacter sp.]|nr:beta-ketoacyl-[acyl-carrier-protein] synthase family protein [Conexibacter sp.]